MMEAFVLVAEKRSFAEASDRLETTRSTISRLIQRLEDSLGVRLFTRTTRQVTLTEAGEYYLRECSVILESLSHADAHLADKNGEPHGSLRLTVPIAFGRLHITAAILDFLDHYKGLTAEINHADRFVDLIGEGYDMAIRIGSLPSSGLVARKLSPNSRLPVATPEYIRRHGEPQRPVHLAAHNCLRYSNYTHSGCMWTFQKGDEIERVEVRGDLISDNSETIVAAALAGRGIGLAARYMVEDELRAGRLVHLLPDYKITPGAAIYIVVPTARHMPLKVRLLSDFIMDRFKDRDW